MPDKKLGQFVTWFSFAAVFSAILLIFIGGPLTSISPTAYSNEYIVPDLQIIEDKSGEMNFDQARRRFASARVGSVPGAKISVGFTDSAWWGKLSINKAVLDGYRGPLMLEFTKPALSSIRAYIPVRGSPDATPNWIVKTTGETEPSVSREILSRSFVFLIPGSYDPELPIYFRIETFVSLNTHVLIWLPQHLANKLSQDGLLFGLVFGVMAAMSLYNLILFLFLREKVYLHYVFYVLSVALDISIIYGLMSALLAPEQGLEPFFRWVCLCAPLFFGPYFLRSFLNLPKTSRFWNGVCLLFMGMALASPLFSFIVGTNAINQIINFQGFASAVLFLILLIDFLRRGYTQVRFLLIAWSTFIFGVLLFTMGGIIIPRSPVTIYTMAVGASFESILLSFALADRIRMLRRSHEKLSLSQRHYRELAERDGLTGLYNRRYTFERLPDEIKTVTTIGGDMSLLIMDVDNFKQFNDTFGHPEGDKVLIKLAQTIESNIRSHDAGCRYGGEEFIVVLPGTRKDDAFRVAERIRNQFGQSIFSPAAGAMVQVTVSIGLTSLEEGDQDADELIKRADSALYKAKSQGKNRTVTQSKGA